MDEHWYLLGTLPKDTTLPETNPDRLPSFSRLVCVERGKDVVEAIEVKTIDGRRLGVLVIAVRGEEESGRLRAHGVSLFTQEEIRSTH